MTNWYEKTRAEKKSYEFIRNIGQRTLDSVKEVIIPYFYANGVYPPNVDSGLEWTTEQRKKLLEELLKDERVSLPANIQWSDSERKLILKIAENNKELSNLPTNIEWTEEEKTEILNIAETLKYSCVLPENIKWNENDKERLFDLARNSKLEKFPENIEWNEDDKETLLDIASLGKITVLPSNVFWSESQRKKILDIAVDAHRVRREEHYFHIFRTQEAGLKELPNNINWDEDDKKRIISLYGHYIINMPSNINWSQSDKESIFETIHRYNDIFEFPEFSTYSIEDKKKIIELLKKKISTAYYIKLPNNVEWNEDEKNEIMNIILKESDHLIHGSSFGLEFSILDVLPQDIDFSEEQKQKIYERFPQYQEEFIKWDDFASVLEYIRKNPDVNRLVNRNYLERIIQQHNPINNLDIYKSLHFEKIPWLSDDSSRISPQNIRDEKVFLLEIFERLDSMGFIDHSIELESKNEYLHSFSFDKDEIKNRISSLNNKTEITSLLLFYLNKLTKVNEITMYYKALGDFEYNIEFDNFLEQNPNAILPVNIQRYKEQRNLAQEKGNLMISTLKYLRGNESNPIERNDNYAYMRRKNQKLQNSNISSYNMPLASFTEFLNYWIKNRDSYSGFIKFDEDNQLKDFYEAFNKNIKDLHERGCSLEEITNTFLYASNALDIEDNLYNVKVGLIQQLLEYSKQPENNVIIQYEEYKKLSFEEIFSLWKDNREKNGLLNPNFSEVNISNKLITKFNDGIREFLKRGFSISDIEKKLQDRTLEFQDFRKSIDEAQDDLVDGRTKDCVYVLLKDYFFPMSFHTNLKKFPSMKDVASEVSPLIKRFFDSNSTNMPIYFSEEEKQSSYFNDEYTSVKIDKLMNDDKYKQLLERDKNFTSHRDFRKLTGVFNDFIEDAIEYIGIDKNSLPAIDSNGKPNELLFNNLQTYISEDTNTSTDIVTQKKMLLANICCFILNRTSMKLDKTHPDFLVYKSNLETLQQMTTHTRESFFEEFDFFISSFEEKKNFLGKIEDLNKNDIPQIEIEQPSENSFSHIDNNLKLTIQAMINSGTTIESLKSIGFSGDILNYAQCYLKQKSQIESVQRPTEKDTRQMTSNVAMSDIKSAENSVLSDLNRNQRGDSEYGE